MSFLFLIAIAFALMWLLLIRPQRRKQNEQMSMQDNLRVGNEIVTAGGLYGTVQQIDEDEVALEIADGVVVRIARRAIAGVMPGEDGEEQDELEGELDEAEKQEPTEATPS